MGQVNKEILLVDDHGGIVLGVSTYLKENIPGIEITSFTEGTSALKQIQVKQYDAYIVDIELKDIGGMELIRKIKAINRNAGIIIYTQHQGVWDIINFQKAGVHGIVIKGPVLLPLKEAVQAVLDGKTYLCEQFRYISMPNNESNSDSHLLGENIQLKDSEMELIQLTAEGKDKKYIAGQTHYAVSSIPKTKARLYKRFLVNGIEELVTKMYANGFPVKKEIKKRKGY